MSKGGIMGSESRLIAELFEATQALERGFQEDEEAKVRCDGLVEQLIQKISQCNKVAGPLFSPRRPTENLVLRLAMAEASVGILSGRYERARQETHYRWTAFETVANRLLQELETLKKELGTDLNRRTEADCKLRCCGT
jgi:hypothetical protein